MNQHRRKHDNAWLAEQEEGLRTGCELDLSPVAPVRSVKTGWVIYTVFVLLASGSVVALLWGLST